MMRKKKRRAFRLLSTQRFEFSPDVAGISKEIAVKNCTVLLKSRLAELEESS